jgi:hypothetical protein
MKIQQTMLVALAAAVTLTSAAAAGPEAAKQRVAITTQSGGQTQVSPFLLSPLRAGALKRDSGTLTVVGAGLTPKRVVIREGQRVEIYDSTAVLKGKRGSLVIRSRAEYVDGGNGYHVGTGTWTVVRGTGQYSRVTGGGRSGHVWLDRGPWSSRNEGLLTLP